MEHLPVIKNPKRESYEIPFLCTEDYDGLGFHGYPEWKGWSTWGVVRLFSYRSVPRSSAVSFLQAWLYFGMLHEFLGVPVQVSDFVIENDAGRLIITTARLSDYVKEAHARFENLTRKEKQDRIVSLDECLKTVHAVSSDGGDIIGTPIAMSIKILISCLEHCKMLFWGGVLRTEECVNVPPGYVLKNLSFLDWNSDLTHSYFDWEDWCPYEVESLRGNLTWPSLYFASNLRRARDKFDYSQCSKLGCKHGYVEEKTYRTKHALDGCTCRFIGPPLGDVERMLEEGGIPIVRIVDNLEHDGELWIEVEDSRCNEAYIAISHVWAHGLGNVHGNTLPMCQILRLRTLVRYTAHYKPQDIDKVIKAEGWDVVFQRACKHPIVPTSDVPHSNVPLWIDTLCVPTSATSRRTAISRMAETYRGAKHVLALDSEILRQSLAGSLEEYLMKVFISDWMRRAWTLQEAVLPRTVLIQFSDGCLDLDDVLNRVTVLQTFLFPAVVDPVLRELDMCFAEVRNLRKSARQWGPNSYETANDNENNSDKPYRNRFSDCWNGFCNRSTSRAGDENIVLSIMLGLDGGRISTVPARNRMKEILSHYECLPYTILFTEGNRIWEDGYRWALSSPSGAGRLIHSEPAYRTESGLVTSLHGYRLRPRGDGLLCEFNMTLEDTRKHYKVFARSFLDESRRQDILHRGNTEYAVLKAVGEEPGNSQYAKGILVSICKEEDDIIYARLECRVGIVHDEDPGELALLHLLEEYAAINAWPLNRIDSIVDVAAKMMKALGLVMEVTPALFRMRIASAISTGADKVWCIG